MKISDIYAAKGLKIKLRFNDSSTKFIIGALVKVEETQYDTQFLVQQFGKEVEENTSSSVLCDTDSQTASYLSDLFDTERHDTFRCMFLIEGVNENAIEVQTFTFRSVTEYKTPIFIQVPDKLFEKTNPEKLYKDYVWEQLGEPALFSLNYKNRKKQNSEVRFLSSKRYLRAYNTVRGIIAESEVYAKDKDYMPVDVYIAPEIKFVKESDSVPTNDGLATDLDKVSNPASYFARWEAYNELSKKLLDRESEEFGEIEYSSYQVKTDLTGTTFEFEIDDELDDSCKGKELGAGPSKKYEIKEPNYEEKVRPIDVGTVKRVSGRRITTFLETSEGFENIPSAGSLSLYTAGDKFIMARRDAARERMMKHESPIKNIVALIEAGASDYELMTDWSTHEVITEELKHNYSRAKDLNPEQINALEIAINTPDIALIQGPPGTGKTTVIKAIAERFREIYESEERKEQKINPDHVLRSPKILISSFQNEAVDNAISTPLPGDIPAFRKTAKRTKDSTKDQYQRSLDKWYTGVKNSITELISDNVASEYVKQRNLLNDKYLSYKNSGEMLSEAAELIKQYLSFNEISYPQDLIDSANIVIKASEGSQLDDEVDPIAQKLEAQRLDKISFADDGAINVKRLLAHLHLRDDLEINPVVFETIENVGKDAFSDEEFDKYVDAIEKLKKQFCRKGPTLNAKDKGAVNECLVALSTCFNNQYMNTLTDVESKKSLILSEFLDRLEQEYEAIVKKYSMTTAATCQTSLDLRDKGRKTFDLVIVDEAARANPLDLFIPMSMGKKLVLVGDHKQLPHMLEPDVIKTIMDDPKFKDLPEIEKSLFERLFGMFLKGAKPKSVLLTRQFRMHPDICKFVSESFYDGLLQTAESVTPELRASSPEINNGKALTFVNIPFEKGGETPGVSKSRQVEVDAICSDVKRILSVDKTASIGIITFYSLQATKIRQNLEMTLNNEDLARIEIGTVDAFQGKEFDYVMLSCVRSNRPRMDGELPKVGFLEKPNRLCVAFSRAIRQLITYGDVETLIQIPCFSKLYDICAIKGGGCYREY